MHGFVPGASDSAHHFAKPRLRGWAELSGGGRQGDVGVNLVARPGGAEATVGPGHHALAPDHVGETDDPLRHKLRVLDQMIEAANPRHEHEWQIWEEVK